MQGAHLCHPPKSGQALRILQGDDAVPKCLSAVEVTLLDLATPQKPPQNLASVRQQFGRLPKEGDIVLNLVTGNVPKHGDKEMVQRIGHAARDGVAEQGSVALQKPPVRTAPLNDQVCRELSQATWRLFAEEQISNAVKPLFSDVSKEAQARGHDGAILGAISSIDTQALRQQLECLWSNDGRGAVLIGHERKYRV